jgi:hypothetical protein
VAAQARAFEPIGELPADCVLVLDIEQPLEAQAAEVTRAVDRRMQRGPAGEDRSATHTDPLTAIEISGRAR